MSPSLRALLALAFAASLTACAMADGNVDAGPRRDGSGDVQCSTGTVACNRTCVDTNTDLSNCGACGMACATGETCTMGVCSSSSMCPGGQSNCGGACVSLDADPTHCGSCTTRCTTGETCASGSCRAAMTCPSGQMDCGGSCVDVDTSSINCGMCGRACAGTEMCSGGTCLPSMCPSGEMRCGSACTDTQTDRANCGACGTACAAGESCVAGSCQAGCAAPRMTCTVGGMSNCVDVQTDANNCGSCGNACTGGRVCRSGSCACGTGLMDCGGRCVDTATDVANCGSCGNACGTDRNCAGGMCACNSPLTLCGSTCTLTTIDNMNCGSCGNACTAGRTCSGGSCVMSPCPSGQMNCSGVCINPTTDASNCGSCGNACAAGASCSGGSCRPANDDRANALPITFGSAEVVIAGTTTGSTHDGPTVSCICTSGGNVWYTFTLTRREAVYFDTAGSNIDTSIFITDSAGNALQGRAASGSPGDGFCNDDSGCGVSGDFLRATESRTSGLLQPGTYYVAVGGCATGSFTLRAQHLPSNIGSFFYDIPLTGMGMTSTVLVGTSAAAGTCGGTASGEDVRWFMTCGGQQEFFSMCTSDGGTWTRSNGTIMFDPSMYLRSAQTGMETSCNDDGPSMGGSNCQGTGGDTVQWGSRLNNIVAPRGINALFVDERTGGSGMNYTIVYTVR